ncbi:MAG: UvrD-helicase domain-containing protein [Firmicutes bacterium]|nr:UvrD-helicase domain-containing protein [Bacillota bacterium]
MAEWTERQKEAIYDRGNSLLVSAAAGSGKTAVLVERIKELILKGEASLDRMLVVTFTKAAASEMRERLRNELGSFLSGDGSEDEKKAVRRQLSLIGRAEICTFDSFAQRLVRSYYQIINVDPGLKVCDQYKSSLLKNEAIDELFSSLYEKKDGEFFDFLDHYSTSRSDANARELILGLFGYVDTLPDPDALLSDPGFIPETLLSMAGDFALEAMEKSRSYCDMLKDIFDAEKMPKCSGIVGTAISDLDSMISGIKSGHAEESIARMLEYTFPRLSAPADEKEKKKALDDLVTAYWTNGAKDDMADFKKIFAGLSLSRLIDEKERLERPLSQLCALTKEFSRIYAEKKVKAGLMDFSDGEHFALRILEDPEVRKECRQKYEHIFVDEYQDSNHLQESLIEAISSGNNVFTVGDVKQSIYRFRHAEPGLFMARYDAYRKGRENCRLINLNSNFRSKAPVIDFVNRLFENLMTPESCGMVYDEDAALKEGSPYTGPCLYEPELYLADMGEEEETDPEIEELKKDEIEALMAADILKKYHGILIRDKAGNERKLEYRDMAVLLRSAKGKAETYYDILLRSGIPVYLERNEGYFDTPEIQVFVNLLRIIDNTRQDVPLISVMHFPSFGFSAEELAKIRIEGRKTGHSSCSFYDALRFVSGEEGELPKKCREFLEKINGWRTKSSALPLADLVWDLLYESGIMVFTAGLSSGEQRLANLRALVDKASEFEKSDVGGLFGFITYIDAISDDKTGKISTGQSGMVSPEDDVVRIMTVHKSKGLEFPFVLFASCGSQIRGSHNSQRAVYSLDTGMSMVLSNKETFSFVKPLSFRIIKEKQSKDELAEEIRLLYVAATRARDIFVMSAADKDAYGMLEKSRIFAVRGAGCSSFVQMALPYFSQENIHVRGKSSFDLSAFSVQAENMEAFMKKLQEGFEVDASKLSMPAEEIRRRLRFDYSPEEGSSEKRKYSVSELAASERMKEGAAAYEREEEIPVPEFLAGKRPLSSAEIGTAYHKVMEHMPFSGEYSSPERISSFIEQLKEKGILSDDEASSVKAERIAAFFDSAVGRSVLSAELLKKETPFVIKHLYEGREILVQGTIDCWFEKDGRLYLLDYKSNYVDLRKKEEEFERLKKDYEPQLELYREALEIIRGKKVEEAYLYLFAAGEYIKI